MIQEIKKEMLKNTDSIIELLDYFNFSHIHLNSKEIRFARDEDGGQNIRIKIENNDYINVSDYVHSSYMDIFSYIIKEKGVTFYEVLQKIKEILGLDNSWNPKKKKELFGGIYNHLHCSTNKIELITYDDKILDQYADYSNILFLRDGISIKTQKFFGLRYSDIDDRIIIPIRNEFGELVGTKGRYNGTPEGENPKYLYPIPVSASQVLFGYCQNYEFLYGAEYIYIGESEKFTMQCHSMGIRNCVSLGSHSLSPKQAKLLIQLCPKNIVFMLDEGLDLKETKNNASVFKNELGIFNIGIYFFDYRECPLVKNKESPSDNGIKAWNEITKKYIKNIEELMEENYGI